MPLRRKNHWVPAFYLSAFTNTSDSSGLLTSYRKHDKKVLQLRPTYMPIEKNLYVISGGGFPETDLIERGLAEFVEGPFVIVRNQLAFGQRYFHPSLSWDKKLRLARFVVFQHLRTPRFRTQQNQFAKFLANTRLHLQFQAPSQMAEELTDVTGEKHTVQDVLKMEEDFISGRLRLEVNEKLWLNQFLTVALSLTPPVAELPYRVINFPREEIVPTSDNPVVFTRREGNRENLGHGGWFLEDTEIILPLSPRTVLVMGNALLNWKDQGTPSWRHRARENIAMSADQWLFSPERIPRLAKLFQNTQLSGPSLHRGEASLPLAASSFQKVKEFYRL